MSLSLAVRGSMLGLEVVLDREVSRRQTVTERDSAIEEWAVAVALLVDSANRRALRIIRRAAGRDLVEDELRAISREVGAIYEVLKEDVAALHRPHLSQLVELGIDHALGGEDRDVAAGLSALEAGVMAATQDSNRAIEQTGAGLMVVAGDAGSMAEAEIANTLADSTAAKGANRLAMVVAVVGIGTYATTKLDTYHRRRLEYVRYVHLPPMGGAHPCVICAPLIDQVFEITKVPMPPRHVRCDCSIEAASKPIPDPEAPPPEATIAPAPGPPVGLKVTTTVPGVSEVVTFVP